ncbi:hypothetical protein GGI43DRAFT_412869 [Trichoderma evansii]
MNAIQQKCRPKHQVLVLKCYPRTTKGAVDVKPNSSELSYLLYYATSRRSKIQKIGAFLEKKTASDVWRMRIGNVQVTLGILAALVEKSPKDAALIAPCILKILDLILRSNDITMIESSLPMWEAFCEHHDASSLFADQAYLSHYVSVVRSYAQLASTQHTTKQGASSRPVQMRWRNAGLGAIKCIATSDALSSVSGRQIDVIVPMILENLWTQDETLLDVLLDRVEVEEKVDTEKLLRRRTSVATVQAPDAGGDANPLAISGTANDVDKMAEEDTGVLAMQCLKSLFVVPSRSQIHSGTAALLRFILERVKQGEKVMTSSDAENGYDQGWAINIFSIIARWAPVQDRYVILVMALDTLTHTPMRDDNLDQHIALTAMVESLLRSDINLIGLSVMDVLFGLIKQIKKLFALSNIGSRAETPSEKVATDSDVDQSPQQVQRRALLGRLEQCIGDLASHIYYADQVSDMIAAMVGRLKPSRSSSAPSTPQGEKTEGNEQSSNASPPSATATADLVEGQVSNSADVYFSYTSGRISALRIVKIILHVANPKVRISTNADLSRNRVPAQVWEGTQWLLRDPSGLVRRAYVDGLLTWLDLETTPMDLLARDEALEPHKSTAAGILAAAKNARDLPNNTRRVVSNASNKDRQPRTRRSQFLAQLHLAIYDNALHFVEFDNDLALLHTLLARLVLRLGVNAVRYGVPMIYRLQEEIQAVEQPIHKVRIAAVCHGYFWILTDKFEFEGSAVGRAIGNEVARRKNKGFWVPGIQVPALPIDQIGPLGQAAPPPEWDLSLLETEELLPFDDRASLIQCIAVGYEENTSWPPNSPSASPGRMLSGPILNIPMSPGTSSAPVTPERSLELPDTYREQMMTEWSREQVAAALAAEGKTESINGSRTGTVATTGLRNLTISTAGGINGNNGYLPYSPYGSQHNLRPHSSQAHMMPDQNHLGPSPRFRQGSIRSGISQTISSSSKAGVASVEQLKRVLSGNASPNTFGSEDDSAESMVSYDYSPSEKSFSPTGTDSDRPTTSADGFSKRSRSGSSGAPLSSGSMREGVPKVHLNGEREENGGARVPPVPPLPDLSSLSEKGGIMNGGGIAVQDYGAKAYSKRNISSRGGESITGRSILGGHEDGGRMMDLQELLRGIDSRPGEGSLGNLTRPPY